MQGFERLQTSVWIGGLAGAVPFYLSILGIVIDDWSILSFIGYAWLILAFLCGVVWRSALENSTAPGSAQGVLLALLLPAVLWLSYFADSGVQLAIAGVGFIAVYVWERSFAWGHYPAGYRVLRTTLTTLVVSAHLILWLVV
jgi:hypothetical protein